MRSLPPDQHPEHADQNRDHEWLRALARDARAADPAGVPAADIEAVFAPLGAAFEADLVLRGLAHVKAGTAAARTADVVPIVTRVSAARARRATATPAHARRTVLAAATGLMALAAAVALWPRSTPSDTLPVFALAVHAGDSAVRSAPTAADPTSGGTLSLDSRLELRLRPARAVDGPLTAALLARLAGGAWRAIPVTPEMAPTGAVRWRGTPRAWFGPHVGSVEIVMIVGRAAAVGHAERTLGKGASLPGPGGDAFVARASLEVRRPGDVEETRPAIQAVPAPAR